MEEYFRNNVSNIEASPKNIISMLQNSKDLDTPPMNRSKKRKLSNGNVDNVSCNSSLNSSASFVSPHWETKLLKADLTESQSKIAALKREIDKQNEIQANLEEKYKQKQQTLEKSVKHYESKTSELEKILSKMRKKEQHQREEMVKMKNQLENYKQSAEDRIYELEMKLKDTQQDLEMEISHLRNENGSLQRLNEDLEMQTQNCQEQLEKLTETNFELREKASKTEELQNALDDEKLKLQNSLSKVKSLEFEIQSFGEWKEFSKTTHSRLNTCTELEKEIVKVRKEAQNLRETLGNKLLLEEQVHNLKSQLSKYENNNIDTISVQVKLEACQKELADWKTVAKNYCPKNSPVNPVTLRSYIEKLFSSTLHLTNENQNESSKIRETENKIMELSTQNEEMGKEVEGLKNKLKHHQSVLGRMQKKMQLVTNERDLLKALLDNYEKDLTITQNIQSNSTDQQTRIRLDMLEKSVVHYKDLVARLETELRDTRTNPGAQEENGLGLGSEQYDNLRKEISFLRAETIRLKRKCDELEIENENLRLRSNSLNGFEENHMKVVHLQANPADIAYKAHADEVSKLKAEIERLRNKIKQMETDNTATKQMNETLSMNMTTNIKSIEELQKKVETLEGKNRHLKEVYQAASQEFREVCFMLFGFKVDRVGNRNWRITSMYADSANHFLNFRLNDESILEMLESDYSNEITDFVVKHLNANTSMPYFLSMLTMDLFNKMTVQ